MVWQNTLLILAILSTNVVHALYHGPTEEKENLQSIAKHYPLANNLSTDQWMVMIWQNNRSQFFEQNIHALKPHSILFIPEKINNPPTHQNASELIKMHKDSWNKNQAFVKYKNHQSKHASQPLYEKPLLDQLWAKALSFYTWTQTKIIRLSQSTEQEIIAQLPLLLIGIGMALLLAAIRLCFKFPNTPSHLPLSQHNEQKNNTTTTDLAPQAKDLYITTDSGDYDLFESIDGGHTKINLAQAYLAMQNEMNAELILESILKEPQKHNKTCINQAEKILGKIRKKQRTPDHAIL